VEASLRRLGTDWIDLYQLHFPDPLTPMEETLRALDDLVRQGKVRYIGSSNLMAWQVVEAHWIARELGQNSFISCQNEYSLVVRDPERELIPAMEAYGLGLLPYFPLASGLLSGKYTRGKMPQGARLTDTKRLADRYMTETNVKAVEALDEFATKHGHTLLELAFSWLAARPVASSVIAGATKPEQVEQNAKAADWALTPDDLAEIDRLTKKT
jgi:aryl-alcohol dehydrogenase-like predicted oxidoreductase